MTIGELEQDLLTLAVRLRKATTIDQLRSIQDSIASAASLIDRLDPEEQAQEAVRRLYGYLDARSAAAVRDQTAALRTEHAEIERDLLNTIANFRRSDGGMELVVPQTAMYELRERIEALESTSGQRWMLARLHNYAQWQGKLADDRAYQRMTRHRPSRTSSSSLQYGAAPQPYREPPHRSRGYER